MPTGQLHARITSDGVYEKCRCTYGEDHYEDGPLVDDYDDDDGNDDSEALSASDAADIWRSNGMDEDYMFGYSDDELRNA